jgi:hypothetical protein
MALDAAGYNRPELEKVIQHYNQNPSDSLKLKAAYFLLENMKDKFSYQGELLDHYYEYFSRPDRSVYTAKSIFDSIAQIYGPFFVNQLEIVDDVKHLKSSFLINNIDAAFLVWKGQPWNKDMNFKQFCEYILPYRIGDEKPEYDRLKIYQKYNGLLDSVRRVGGDAIAACTCINNELIRGGWHFYYLFGFLPHFSVQTLLNERIGNCRDMADLAVHVMRALGIPVAIDFTPQWANRSEGHNWNVIIDKTGEKHEFVGVESNPDFMPKGHEKKAKVYRHTFSRQMNSLAVIKGKKDVIPPFFEDAYFEDVSDEYGGSDINITLDNENSNNQKYAYLSVFDNQDWVPIHWGTIDPGNRVTFSKMGRDIVYLPVFYNGQIIPASSPFLLSRDGCIKILKPDFNKKQRMRLLRKFAMLGILMRLDHMVGGKFQGANRSDFKDKVDLNVINTLPSPFYQIIDINNENSFRYLRYYTPPGGQCNIAELEFYGSDSIKPLKGKIIGSPGSWDNQPDRVKEKAMDGNTDTFFDLVSDSAWVGIDLGINNKQKVRKIRFMPANDDNNIRPGDDYELFCWNTGEWISAGRQVAKTYELIFDGVPSGALYLLHNYTRGNEERIFTYENGEQEWW